MSKKKKKSFWHKNHIVGTEGDDVLTGTERSDKIRGNGGDDVIFGLGGHDKIWGGDGDDIVSGGDGHDSIWGGDGGDILAGDGGNDRISGGDGTDQLFGGEGHDWLYGGRDDDVLVGGGGNDRLSGGRGNDVLAGGEGNDRVYGGRGNDTLIDAGGNDFLFGGGGDDFVFGGAGRDHLYGGQGDDTLDGHDGDDKLYGGQGNDEISGGDGDDWIKGGRGDDEISAGAGHDKVWGQGGDDTIDGGAGNDWLGGGRGDDTILGGEGTDDLSGGRGDDMLDGGAGSDWLDAGRDDDMAAYTVVENTGHWDWYDGNRGSDTLRIDVTQAEFDALRDELSDLQDFIAAHANPGQHHGPVFQTSFGLKVRNFETLEIYVDGVGPVDPGNAPPETLDSELATNLDTSIDGQLTGIDPDEDPLTFAIDDGPDNGTVTLNPDGSYTYTPGAGFLGQDSFSFTVEDPSGEQSTATVSITVAAYQPEFLPATGTEIAVNETTSDSQTFAGIDGLTDGGYVVTWSSFGQDGSTWAAMARRYDADGNAMGGEFQANTTTFLDQAFSDVTGLADGGFLVSWSSLEQVPGGLYDIFAQRYDANGNAVGGEFRINDATALNQAYGSVAGLSNGGFVASWSHDNGGTDLFDTVVRVFDASGTAVTGDIVVNQTTVGDQFQFGLFTDPIAALASGGFAVSWGEWTGQDGDDWGIYTRIFDDDGNALTSEIQVNTETTGTQVYTSLGALEDGGFVVTWSSFGQDGDGWGIYGQRFDADGMAVGDEFQSNTYTTANQLYSEVDGLPDGGFVVTWQSWFQDGSGEGVYGQRYDVNGDAVGGEFRINEATAENQLYASIAVRTNGDYTVAWTSDEEIVARNYDSVAKSLDGTDGNDSYLGSADNDVLSGAGGNDTIDGERGHDILNGGAGDDRLIGGIGNDVLTGGDDDDLFVFQNNGSNDAVTDFVAGIGTGDVLDVSSFGFASEADAIAAATQIGADTVIQLDIDDSLTLLGVNAGNLHDDDFLI